MGTTLNPYLAFTGQARDAMTFYQSVFGGELQINTFADFGMNETDETGDHIMHAQLETPAGFTLMASDGSYNPGGGDSFSVSLSGDQDAELRGYWDKLSEGAEIQQPLEAAPWGDHFGALKDKFGVNWLMNITGS